MAINQTVITGAGRNLIAKATAGETIWFTRIVLGDGEIDVDLNEVDSMSHGSIEVPINSTKMKDPSTAVISGQYSTADLQDTFYFRELGVYAEDPDDGEVLFSYGYADEPEQILPNGSATAFEEIVDVLIKFENSVNVSAFITADTAASLADYEELYKMCRKALALATSNEERLDNLEPRVKKNEDDIAALNARLNKLESRVMTMWFALFNDIAANRSTINFDTYGTGDATDATITIGVWNETMQRAEF